MIAIVGGAEINPFWREISFRCFARYRYSFLLLALIQKVMTKRNLMSEAKIVIFLGL